VDMPSEWIWKGLALELKSPGGRLRPTQAWWLAKMKNQGRAVAVAWSFDEARTLITDYLRGEHRPQESLDLSIAEPPRHVGSNLNIESYKSSDNRTT